MSNLAEMTHECEVCGVELHYHGGPYRPRWCDEHRPEKEQARARRRLPAHERLAAAQPPVFCSGCRSRLLRKAEDGLCGFCRVELREAA